jgi:RNA polymerase sigma-70 factor (ECF subfamily)
VESSFVRLLMEHRSMLHSFVFAISRDPHQTEDILQEVAVVLWSKFSEFREGSDFGAWSRSIAYRELLSARRVDARARRHLDESCAREILAAYQRRSETVDTTVHREALRRCLGSMGGDLRDIMHCRFGLRMSSREIAGRFSRTSQGVDALVYRAKKLLSDCVRTRLSTGGDSL